MATRRTPGLRNRGGTWHIQKRVRGIGAINESTGTSDLAEAERYLAHRIQARRASALYGERARRTFNEACIKYLEENQHLRSIDTIAYALKRALPYIGSLWLEDVHDDTLAAFKREALARGLRAGSVNKTLSSVRRVLNLAARRWRDGGKTWLASAPLITMVSGPVRRPYPLSWAEQGRLFAALPRHLADMALFKVNTGTREAEVLALQWAWEVQVPELEASVFVVPGTVTKNGEDRLIVLNSIARRVVDEQRGKHPAYVFTYKGQRLASMENSAWRKAWKRAGLPGDADTRRGVHNLKHTFGHRLRAAGVRLEDRKPLLGHTSGDITTHYSAVDIGRLLECAERVVEQRPTTILRAVGGAKVGQSVGQKAALGGRLVTG